MDLRPGDIVVVDASVMITREGGRKVVKKLEESQACLAVCDKLLDEYRENVRYASGMSPLVFEWHRLGPLKEKGLYRHVRDKDMLRVVPEQEEDSHIGNLAATVGAKVIVMRNKKSAPTLRQTYGLPVVSLKEFLDCM